MTAVVEAFTRLSTFSETQILEPASEGKVKDLFTLHPRSDELPVDTVAEQDLVEASAVSLSREQRAALIQSSIPSRARSPTASKRGKATKKTQSEG